MKGLLQIASTEVFRDLNFSAQQLALASQIVRYLGAASVSTLVDFLGAGLFADFQNTIHTIGVSATLLDD